MGYRDKNGVVGKYRGHDVYVVSYEDLRPAWKYDKNTIFAVRTDAKHQSLELVLEGEFIGEMTDGGNVSLFETRREYRWPQEKKFVAKQQKPVAEQQKEVPEPDPTTLEIDVSEGYGAYSRVVDEFFKGLDKLWAELEV